MSPRPRAAVAGALLFLAALALHALVAWQYLADPYFDTYVSDALSYHEWARRLATSGIAAEPVFHQSPLFPLLLSRLYALGPDAAEPFLALGFQILLGSCAVALLVPLGRVYFGSIGAGVAAGCLALLHAPLVYYDLKLLPIPLALLTQGAGLWLLGRARESAWTALLPAAGAAWGLACLTRAEMVLFLPVALLVLWRRDGGRSANRPARIGRLLLYLGGVALVVFPATLHNARRGDRVLIASAAGENLFIGNQRGADGSHQPLHPQAGDLFSQRALAERIAEEALERPLQPSAVSAYWRGRAVAEILEAPGEWLVLELRKLGRVLHPGDPNDMYPLALERTHYLSALHLALLPPWGLWILGSLGLAAALCANARRVGPLAALLGLHLLVLLAFFVSTRLRLPLLFFLALPAGHAILLGVRRLREPGRRALPLAITVVLLIVTVSSAWVTRPTTRDVLRLASVLSMRERFDESLAVIEPYIESGTTAPALLLDQAGWVRYQRGEIDAARQLYERALDGELAPARETQVRTRLAWAYEKLGRLVEAEREHDLAVSSTDANAGTLHERGVFLLRRSRREEAIRDLLRAVELDPGYSSPRAVLRELGVDPR